MISFDAAHAAVHYPPDRRHRIWVRPSLLVAAAVIVLLPVGIQAFMAPGLWPPRSPFRLQVHSWLCPG